MKVAKQAVTAMKAHEQAHVLETNAAEREWFSKVSSNYATAWRRAVELLTGSLPTWAERQAAGRQQSIPPEQHAEVLALLAQGAPVSKVAARFSVARGTIARIRDVAVAA